MRNQPVTMLFLLGAGLLGGTFSGGILGGGAAFAQDAPAAALSASTAPAGAIQIARPFNKAIVRESVPIRLRDFPAGGYISVSIDGQFVTAQALPKNASQSVYVWDTKASYTSPDDPNTPKTYKDGFHAITIAVYDAQNKLVGQDSVSVQLANAINLPASQGIKLVYPWNVNLSLRYQRRTELSAISTDAASTVPAQILQQSLLRFRRTVENVSGGTSLIRDEVIPVDSSARPKPFVSYVATHGQSQSLTDSIRAKYREVDSRGRVLSELKSQNSGNSLGFSIPVLPPRRVSVGAHWETPVQITLDWANLVPQTVTATSTLEDFEWQDRYPTAKIRETYTGPATFYPGPGAVVPALATQDVKFERIVYFAYNAGRVVRTQTTITFTTTTPGLLNAAPGVGGYPGGPPGGVPGGFVGRNFPRRRGGFSGGGMPGGSYPGSSDDTPALGGPPTGYPGGPPTGYPGGPPTGYPGGPPTGYPGGPPTGYPGGPPTGYPGGYPGGAPGSYPGAPGSYPGAPGGYPGASGGPDSSPTKLTYMETSVLLT